jgi:hypothetical protein
MVTECFGHGPVAGTYEHSNEASGFTENKKFIDVVSYYHQLLKEVSAL